MRGLGLRLWLLRLLLCLRAVMPAWALLAIFLRPGGTCALSQCVRMNFSYSGL
jgi:hypothetical protein